MSGRHADRIRVVHVDDDPGFAESAALLLEQRDDRLEVEPTTDPQTVLDRAVDASVDCVIADYEMPEMDGLELLERVRERDPDLPFLLFTGKGSERIASEAISAGVTDYLQKGGGADQWDLLANRVGNAAETRRTERQLARDHSAMAAAWDGIATLDADGQLTYVNESYADTFGYDVDELVGEDWTVLYPDGEAAVVEDEIIPTVRAAGTWTGEGRFERADGSELVAEHTVGSVPDGEGFVCVVRDRTTRGEEDRELRHLQERFRLLVEAVEEYAMFTLDEDGYVASWNVGAERIEGYTEDEIVGEHVSTFYTDREREAGRPGELLETAASEGSVTETGPRVRADGSLFWADVTITALRDDGQLRGFATVIRDITERRRREHRQARAEVMRRELYEITTERGPTLEEKVVDVLSLGAEYLGVEHGHLTTIDPDDGTHRIVAVSGPHPSIESGMETPLSESYCRKTIGEDDLLTAEDAVDEGWADDPAYQRHGLGCYLGAKLEVEGTLFGTTCFVDREPREEPFRHDEKTFVELLTRWLTVELERRGGQLDYPIAP